MIWICFFMAYPEARKIALDDFGLFQDTHLTLFQTRKGFLLNSTREGVAVLFNEGGEILGRLDRQGRGPGEFYRQYVLAVNDEGIHFCTNGRFIMSFDHRLKPLNSSWPTLPAKDHLNANFGLVWQTDTILVSLSGRDRLFAEVQNIAGDWRVRRNYFPTATGNLTDGGQFLMAGKRPLIHNGTVFASKVAVSLHESSYEIEVFEAFLHKGDQDASTVLTAEVDFPGVIGIRALIYAVVRTPNGFVVELFTHLRSGGRNRRWHDYYNLAGGFLKRVNMDHTRLLPVINGSGVFLIDDRGERRVLKRIH